MRGTAVWSVVLLVLVLAPLPGIAGPARSDQMLVDLGAAINRARQHRNLQPVQIDDRLMRVAQDHADDMIAHRFFAHSGSDGRSVGDRAHAAGYRFAAIAETLAIGQPTAVDAVAGWAASPPHARILYDARFHALGVAYRAGPLQYRSKTLPHLWVAVFATGRTH